VRNTCLEKTAILIVDGHELVREGMARLLNDALDIEIVGQLSSGEEVLEYLSYAGSNRMSLMGNAACISSSYQMPDIILLDARLEGGAGVPADGPRPSLGGIEVMHAILKQSPNCKIVAMSSVANDIIPSQMMRLGARGFISKSVSVEELLQAVRIVSAGDYYVPPSVSTNVTANHSGRFFDKLSRRELQISQMLSDGKKVSQISMFLDLSPKTVYAYRYRLFDKLGIRSDVELTILALNHGLADYTY